MSHTRLRRLAEKLKSSDRREARWAVVSSLQSQRKGGLGGRFSGFAWDALPLPVAPGSPVSWRPLEFRREE